MPRRTISISKALESAIQHLADQTQRTFSQTVADVLADHFKVAAQDNTWGGNRKGKEKTPQKLGG